MKRLKTRIVFSLVAISTFALFQNCGNFSAIAPVNLQLSSLGSTAVATATPNLNSGKVTLSWTASPSSQTTGYIIQQSKDGVTFTETTRVASVTTATVTGLAAGSYIFRVEAYNSAGTSAPTATIAAVVPAKTN